MIDNASTAQCRQTFTFAPSGLLREESVKSHTGGLRLRLTHCRPFGTDLLNIESLSNLRITTWTCSVENIPKSGGIVFGRRPKRWEIVCKTMPSDDVGKACHPTHKAFLQSNSDTNPLTARTQKKLPDDPGGKFRQFKGSSSLLLRTCKPCRYSRCRCDRRCPVPCCSRGCR